MIGTDSTTAYADETINAGTGTDSSAADVDDPPSIGVRRNHFRGCRQPVVFNIAPDGLYSIAAEVVGDDLILARQLLEVAHGPQPWHVSIAGHNQRPVALSASRILMPLLASCAAAGAAADAGAGAGAWVGSSASSAGSAPAPAPAPAPAAVAFFFFVSSVAII